MDNFIYIRLMNRRVGKAATVSDVVEKDTCNFPLKLAFYEAGYVLAVVSQKITPANVTEKILGLLRVQ